MHGGFKRIPKGWPFSHTTITLVKLQLELTISLFLKMAAAIWGTLLFSSIVSYGAYVLD